jgi:hypothetical protein
MKACPVLITRAEGSRLRPRIARSRDFRLGAGGPPLVEEGPVGADEHFVEDGHVCQGEGFQHLLRFELLAGALVQLDDPCRRIMVTAPISSVRHLPSSDRNRCHRVTLCGVIATIVGALAHNRTHVRFLRDRV